MTVLVSSPAFSNGSYIPVEYTCDGADISPPLEWRGAPPGARAFAVVVVDVDAPGGEFVHWVLYNIPANVTRLPAGIPREPVTPRGWQAVNDFGRVGWGGPCPPPGRPHRYVFRVYAVSAPVDITPGAPARRVLAELTRLAVACGELVGLYRR
jgi:Raf kinase inhibitor-like YbhB/YbcL family protein